jgi:hypothetical protein
MSRIAGATAIVGWLLLLVGALLLSSTALSGWQ